MSEAVPQALGADFSTIADLVRLHAQAAPRRRALVQGEETLDYGTLDAQMDSVAAALQRDGVQAGEVIALCAATSLAYAVTYLGALRAGVVVAPLAPGATAESLAAMLHDAGARLLFTDAVVADLLGDHAAAVPRVALDGSAAGPTWTQ